MSGWISLSYYSFMLPIVTLGVVALAIALLMLRVKSIVYSVYLLAFLGITVAGIMALLGFQVIGALHIIVYVGAAVLFFIITISMMGDVESKPVNIKSVVLVSPPLFIVFYIVLNMIVKSISYNPAPTLVGGLTISRYLTSEYYPQLIIAIFAIAVSVVESIVIAMKELR